MSHLWYENNEALRCADEQELAAAQLIQAKQPTNELSGQVHKTYGSAAAYVSQRVAHILHQRDHAIEAMQQACDRLAQYCRQANAAYLHTDQRAAENLH